MGSILFRLNRFVCLFLYKLMSLCFRANFSSDLSALFESTFECLGIWNVNYLIAPGRPPDLSVGMGGAKYFEKHSQDI